MAPVSSSFADRQAYVSREYIEIKRLAMASQLSKEVPDYTGISKKRYDKLRDLLTWLESGDAKMSDELKEKTKINELLLWVYAKPLFHFPEEFRDRAKALYERFERIGWEEDGPGPSKVRRGIEVDSDDDEVPIRKHMASNETSSRESTQSDNEGTIRLPPANHSIWGTEAIMHGLALKLVANGPGTGKYRRAAIIDPRFKPQQRYAKVFGHNGIPVGTWYPYQMSALFYGAHGEAQAGIHGNIDEGAYSVVIAGHYDTLDFDSGNSVCYSGSGSHTNTDPNRPAEPSPGTKALHTSMRTGNPVRVLRAHSGKSKWAPNCGIRYDGLYQVASVSTPENDCGGLYEQFLLVRLDDQPEIDYKVPNGKQIAEFEDIYRINPDKWATG